MPMVLNLLGTPENELWAQTADVLRPIFYEHDISSLNFFRCGGYVMGLETQDEETRKKNFRARSLASADGEWTA